jgi:hypothetical protein
VLALGTALLFGQDRKPVAGPRGKPIRPPASRLTNEPPDIGPASTVLTLPGGVVITNLPQQFLPRTTNVIRLPTHAARKFEPLGYQSTSFTVLARFFLKLPEPASEVARTPGSRWDFVRGQIPEDVLAMDGRKVALAGFLLPLAVSNGRTTEFLLLRTQSACCFGMVPRVNELVMVKMAPPGVTPMLDTPIVAAGTLSVKWIGEGGQLTAIYEMQADKVERAEGS